MRHTDKVGAMNIITEVTIEPDINKAQHDLMLPDFEDKNDIKYTIRQIEQSVGNTIIARIGTPQLREHLESLFPADSRYLVNRVQLKMSTVSLDPLPMASAYHDTSDVEYKDRSTGNIGFAVYDTAGSNMPTVIIPLTDVVRHLQYKEKEFYNPELIEKKFYTIFNWDLKRKLDIDSDADLRDYFLYNLKSQVTVQDAYAIYTGKFDEEYSSCASKESFESAVKTDMNNFGNNKMHEENKAQWSAEMVKNIKDNDARTKNYEEVLKKTGNHQPVYMTFDEATRLNANGTFLQEINKRQGIIPEETEKKHGFFGRRR